MYACTLSLFRAIYHFFKIPIKRQATPQPIQIIFPQDSLSAIPASPMDVVTIRIVGPTSASAELTASALSTLPSFSMSRAAKTSMVPENIRSVAILTTNLSSISTFASLSKWCYLNDMPVHFYLLIDKKRGIAGIFAEYEAGRSDLRGSPSSRG